MPKLGNIVAETVFLYPAGMSSGKQTECVAALRLKEETCTLIINLLPKKSGEEFSHILDTINCDLRIVHLLLQSSLKITYFSDTDL